MDQFNGQLLRYLLFDMGHKVDPLKYASLLPPLAQDLFMATQAQGRRCLGLDNEANHLGRSAWLGSLS